MALSVISFATYKRPPYRDGEYHSLKFVKAIKGKPFQGWADVPVVGRLKRLRPANADDAIDWFGELAAVEIVKLNLRGPLILVPLPNSSSTVDSGVKSRTAHLAEAIASKLNNAQVWDGLRWIEEEIPTHQEGTREPQLLYENLAIVGSPPKGTIILIDDVYTKGGHLQAARARLEEKKAICQLAFCAGRTVLEPQEAPFLILRAEVPDFKPVR
jgi:hypothetical protein